jgi:acyl carrier protein
MPMRWSAFLAREHSGLPDPSQCEDYGPHPLKSRHDFPGECRSRGILKFPYSVGRLISESATPVGARLCSMDTGNFEAIPAVLYSAPARDRGEMNDVVEKIRNYIASEYLSIAPEDLPADYPLVSSGLIDSFNLVDLALFVEDSFQVHLEDTELNAAVFDTLDQLAALIKARG